MKLKALKKMGTVDVAALVAHSSSAHRIHMIKVH